MYFYETRESILETGSITTKLTQIFIIDLLYTQVVKDTMDLASAFKQRTTEAINILRLDNKNKNLKLKENKEGIYNAYNSYRFL